MVANFLASTPLPSESWRLCSVANTTAPYSFVSDQVGDVGYFAFSGIQIMTSSSSEEEYHSRYRYLVPLDSAGPGLFTPLMNNNRTHNNPIDGEEEAVMVHAGLVNRFLCLYNSQPFQDQMLSLTTKCKSIVITGHSIGGTTASLCALWLLSRLQAISSPLSVLCITFGSPLLGNESLSQAILRERWGGNFCHVVSKYDIMPRLLFAPLEACNTQLHFLLQYWQASMIAPHLGNLRVQLRDEEKAEFFCFISACLERSSQAEEETVTRSSYWPFGNYLLCSQEGAICVDNAASVIKMMHLMFITGDPTCCIEDHLKYGEYVGKISSHYMNKRSFMQGELPDLSYEAGIALALQSSGISIQESAAEPAKECLKMARRLGCTPNLKCADLAIRLSKITPYRAELEWYKENCDKSDEQLGYYDSFKQGGNSKRNYKVNMNRHKLGAFWKRVIDMLDNNELPYDFHKRAKWVNASHFYKLLVEPLDIAEYYRAGMHHVKGHYLNHGRERRFEIFDRWWAERSRTVYEEQKNSKRSKFAGLTQDSCFWAKVEEARELLANVRSESDVTRLRLLWDNINKFERYATSLIQNKEVSEDVLAKKSSYKKWEEELHELRSQIRHIHPQFPSLRDGELVP